MCNNNPGDIYQGWGAGRSRVFLAPEPELEPLEKKTRSRSRLEKKSGAEAGAAWKKSQEPEPEPLKNLPAPQPCPRGGIRNFVHPWNYLWDSSKKGFLANFFPLPRHQGLHLLFFVLDFLPSFLEFKLHSRQLET